MYYFYVLKSQETDNWFYKGVTRNLDRRLRQHNNGETLSSSPHKPFRLVYYEAYLTFDAALRREQSVKKSGSVWKPLMDRIKRSLVKKKIRLCADRFDS